MQATEHWHPLPLSLTLTAELGATKARPDQARHSATLGPSAGLTSGHLVLALTPSPPTWASAQSRVDRELRAAMPVDQYLSLFG